MTDQTSTTKMVAKGKVLHLPGQIINHKRGPDRIWLKEGQVLDVGDPFIAFCVKGQEYKLVDAPGRTPTAPEHRLIAAYRRELAGHPAVAPVPEKAVAAVAAATSEKLDVGIEAPDLPPPTPKKVKS